MNVWTFLLCAACLFLAFYLPHMWSKDERFYSSTEVYELVQSRRGDQVFMDCEQAQSAKIQRMIKKKDLKPTHQNLPPPMYEHGQWYTLNVETIHWVENLHSRGYI